MTGPHLPKTIEENFSVTKLKKQMQARVKVIKEHHLSYKEL
jgi:hypothetical protein